MARGWESKSIEGQQDDAVRRETPPRRTLTPEQQQRERTAETLRLALAHTRSALAAARAPAHREMLAQQARALEHQLANLASDPRAAGR